MIEITFALSVKSSHSGKDINRLVEQGFVELHDVMYTGLTQLIEDNVILNCSVATNENSAREYHYSRNPGYTRNKESGCYACTDQSQAVPIPLPPLAMRKDSCMPVERLHRTSASRDDLDAFAAVAGLCACW